MALGLCVVGTVVGAVVGAFVDTMVGALAAHRTRTVRVSEQTSVRMMAELLGACEQQ